MEYSTVGGHNKDPDSEAEAVATLLRELRQRAGLRQEELARRLGRSQSYVSKYENCEKGLYVSELLDICRALDISFVTLASLLESELAR